MLTRNEAKDKGGQQKAIFAQITEPLVQGFGRILWLWFVHISGNKTCSVVFSSRTCSSAFLVYRNGVAFVAARWQGEGSIPSHSKHQRIVCCKECAHLLADTESCGYVNHCCAAHKASIHVRVTKAISRRKRTLGAKVLLSPGAALHICAQQMQSWSRWYSMV